MAENKSDFIRDPLKLLAEAEKMEATLRQKFNLSSARQEDIKAVTNPITHKPVLEFRTAVGDFSGMLSADGWKYGVYYFENPPKTGFFKMIDGKQIFIEVEQKYNSLATYPITTAQEFGGILIDKNPGLNDNNIHIEGNTIRIDVPTMDHLEMPSSEWVYDAESGLVRSTSREYAFEIVVTNSASINTGYNLGEQGSYEHLEARSAMEAENARKEDKTQDEIEEQSEEVKITLEDLSPSQMFETYQRYKLNNANGSYQSQNKEMDGTSRSMDLRTKNQISEKKILFLNNLWIQACAADNNGIEESADKEFMKSENLTLLGIIMATLRSGQPVSQVFMGIAQEQTIEDKQGAVMIAYTFLQSLKNNAGLSIELNASMEDYLSAMSSMNTPSLDDSFDGPVMEKKPTNFS